MLYKCPVCDEELQSEDKQLICASGHSFDLAKKGYVNLLLSNQKNAKDPGDSKEMVRARHDFLSKGYYQCLADMSADLVVSNIRQGEENNILDIGCGEGFFTAEIEKSLDGQNMKYQLWGIDISKHAINAAASRSRRINFTVGSNFNLPYMSNSFDQIIWMFAPAEISEINRVIKKGGFLITANPGPKHLMGLKKMLYKDVYENEERPYEIEGFDFKQEETVKATIQLNSSKEINDLLQMTPYYWHISKEASEKASRAVSLNTELEFKVRIYKKL